MPKGGGGMSYKRPTFKEVCKLDAEMMQNILGAAMVAGGFLAFWILL